MTRQVHPHDDADAPGDVRERVQRTELPPNAMELIVEYERTVGKRDRYLWKWLYAIAPHVTLSCVPEGDEERVREVKLLASLFVVMLDDIAEATRDESTFQEARKIPFPHQQAVADERDVDGEFVRLAERVWECVETAIRTAPRDREFRDVLEFDVQQTLNAIDYSYLAGEVPELVSLEELERYDAHNMMLFTYVDLDLMFAPSFDRGELAGLRRLTCRAQRMARIGNWVTTWERELGEGDFSSGVVVAALADGVVSPSELRRLRDGASPEARADIAARIDRTDIEGRLLARSREYRNELDRDELELAGDGIASVDVDSFVDGIETVMDMHLESRGLL